MILARLSSSIIFGEKQPGSIGIDRELYLSISNLSSIRIVYAIYERIMALGS